MNPISYNYKTNTSFGKQKDVSSMVTKSCEECNFYRVEVFCKNCEELLCSSCDQRIHNKAARINHHRSLIDYENLHPSVKPRMIPVQTHIQILPSSNVYYYPTSMT